MVELGKDPRWGVGGNSATTKEQWSAASPWASIASIAMGFERARNLGAQTKLGVVLPYDIKDLGFAILPFSFSYPFSAPSISLSLFSCIGGHLSKREMAVAGAIGGC